MFFAIISFALYFVAMMLGLGEKSIKGTIIRIGTLILTLVNLYRIFTHGISDIPIINGLFGAIYFVILLFALLMLIPFKKTDKPPRDTPQNNVTIEDNGNNIYTPHLSTDDQHSEIPTEGNNEGERLRYSNVHLNNGVICNISGLKDDFKISITLNGKLYEFYVRDGQTIAYRTEQMIQPQNY